MTRTKNMKRILKLAGGPTKLADHLGCSVSAVSQWPEVPIKRVCDVAELLEIPPGKVRSDGRWIAESVG